MKKIPTILPKNPNDLGLVIPGEIMKGIKYFQLKIDGTSSLIKEGNPYGRYDAKIIKTKKGKKTYLTKEEVSAKLPIGSIPCQEPDEKSGHWPHWIPLLKENPEQKYLIEAFENLENKIDGTYETIGPKIQGNPHNEEKHVMVPHFSDKLRFNVDMNKMTENPYEYFKELFKDFPFEGLVAYNEKDEPIGKIRRSDFGYKNDKFNSIS